MKIKEYQIVVNNGFNILRVVSEREYNGDCRNSDDTINMMNELFYMNKVDYEYLYVIARDDYGNLIGVYQLSHGMDDVCYLNFKELYSFLFIIRANSFELVHNHPGILCWEPSLGDVKTTKKLLTLKNSFNIKLNEDYIIHKDGYTKTLKAIENNEVKFRYIDGDEDEEKYNVSEECMKMLISYVENDEEISERIKYDEEIEVSLCGAVSYITEQEKHQMKFWIKAIDKIEV